MVSHLAKYFITTQILEIHVWTVIIWLVMHITTCLKYERLDVVSTKYIHCPIIKIDIMTIIEDHLVI